MTDRVTRGRATLERAITALAYHQQQTRPIERTKFAIDELRAALAAQPAEPVARVVPYGVTVKLIWEDTAAAHNCKPGPLYAAPPAPAAVPPDDVGLPSRYMLAKLQMVMPLFQEARDALPAISEVSRRARGISPTLGDRMDAAGTFSLDDWIAAAGDKP